MLLKIYKKEMLDSFRDRRTLLLTVFLPIIMMTGLTLFYESMLSDGEGNTYKLAVPSSISAEEEAIFSGFDLIEIVKTDNPEQALQDGETLAAVLFSPNFNTNINEGKEASITIVGDSFSQNASVLMSTVTAALSNYEKMVITERLQAQGTDISVIEPFTVHQKELAEEKPGVTLLAMLVPLILALAIGVGASPAASDLFAGEKEKKTMEALLMTPVNRLTLLFAKWLTISSVGAITGIITLAVVALEIQFLTENLKQAISFDGNAGLIISFAIFLSIVYAMFIASLLMLTSILGKTVKESQSYSSPIMMVTVFPVMIISGMGINELSNYHFIIPVMNLFSLFKELLFGVINYEHIILTFTSNIVLMIIVFVIGRILFMKDKWVMN
ncbi:ABC transporter permease [Alkalihalobacterium bogoriense]|uniref:ABC transporter permease n=1 Tax=Alkalihalobacterium bogoriense TaxID=246272 RepID=UPI0004792CF3|nr:ABC transporter permease [Alkalihalobacterium bogoriense]